LVLLFGTRDLDVDAFCSYIQLMAIRDEGKRQAKPGMKLAPISQPFPVSPEEVEAAIEAAPGQTADPEGDYDPNDGTAVDTYWKSGTVRRLGQRGQGKRPRKVLLSVRYSPEVVDYFKSTGEGWQSRMDEALREWIASRRTA
jgi:uncharacterized protein (DUF4415 family)